MPRTLSLPVCNHKPAPYAGPSLDEVLAMRQQYLSPGIVRYYSEPLMLVEGHMQYVWDETGKRYLDGLGGIATVSVGHSHPKVVERVKEQVGTLAHATTVYLHPTIGQFAKKLTEHMPAGSDLSSCYFTNSGSEANEMAVLAAREHTEQVEVISLRHGYHGGTGATMALTAQSTWKFKSAAPLQVRHALAGYCYRCPFGLEYPSCELKCAHDVKNVIEQETSGQVALFIAECIQGIGGVITPPKEYFKIVYDIVRKHGGLCAADEVQAGLGRSGDKFWAFENYDVTPDIVTLAKGLGNGAPLGAMVTKPEISKALAKRAHFNTFGGNPVSMAAGLATLEVIDSEKLQENARTIGSHLKSRLLELQERHLLIGEVRGMGLLIGVELVKDRKTREPATAEAASVLEKCKERSLLLGRSGLYGNVLRFTPPMCLTRADADYMADCLDEILQIGAGSVQK